MNTQHLEVDAIKDNRKLKMKGWLWSVNVVLDSALLLCSCIIIGHNSWNIKNNEKIMVEIGFPIFEIVLLIISLLVLLDLQYFVKNFYIMASIFGKGFFYFFTLILNMVLNVHLYQKNNWAIIMWQMILCSVMGTVIMLFYGFVTSSLTKETKKKKANVYVVPDNMVGNTFGRMSGNNDNYRGNERDSLVNNNFENLNQRNASNSAMRNILV